MTTLQLLLPFEPQLELEQLRDHARLKPLREQQAWDGGPWVAPRITRLNLLQVALQCPGDRKKALQLYWSRRLSDLVHTPESEPVGDSPE